MPKRKLPEGTVAFRLENVCEKVGFPSYFNPREPLNLYGQLKNGVKPSEWRVCTPYWLSRLCKITDEVQKEIKDLTKSHKQRGLGLPPPMDLTNKLKVHKGWFFEGYSSGKLVSLPHLEAEIIGLWYHPEKKAFEIKILNFIEIQGRHHNKTHITKSH
jgi:hypothetical protein